jgi:hypothetical protein
VRFDERKLAQAEAFFARHGEKTVFLGRFVPVGRIFSAVLAGVSQMRYGRFLIWNATGGIVWAALMGTLGYLFGHQLPLIERLVSQFGFGLLGVLIAFVVARIAWSRREGLAAWWSRLWDHPTPARLREAVAALLFTRQLFEPRHRWLLAGAGLLALSGAGALVLMLT